MYYNSFTMYKGNLQKLIIKKYFIYKKYVIEGNLADNL